MLHFLCPGLPRGYVLATLEEAARQLYDVLHLCDQLGLRSIIVLMPPDEPEWLAVRDRPTATRTIDQID